MHKRIKRIVCACLAALLLFVSYAPQGQRAYASTPTQSELEQQLADFNKKKEEIDRELNKLKGDKNAQAKYQSELNKKIRLIENQLITLNGQIASLNEDITRKTAEIEETQKKIDENYELFKRRLRAMYMTNDTGYLGAVLGSGSFSEMLMRAETLKRVTEHDNKLIKELSEAKKLIEQDLKKIEENKASIETMKQTTVAQRNELNTAYSQSQAIIDQLAKLEEKYKNDRENIERQEAAIEAELKKFLEQNGSGGGLSSNYFTWPVPGWSFISSQFGWRVLYGKDNYHTGVDIAGWGIQGQKIVASNHGTVIRVVHNYTPGVGYGKYLIVDHGGGYTTLYAHCETISVVVGQTVTRGQELARVGTTGNSTGYHLHFEVRINGNYQNPLNYISYN